MGRLLIGSLEARGKEGERVSFLPAVAGGYVRRYRPGVDEVRFDRSVVAAAFDAYGEREWERHDASASERVAFEIHRDFLARFIRASDRVLEVGAGPGRFTIELARLGAKVTVVDISPGQLELNRSHIEGEGLEDAVEDRVLADLVDLSRFAGSSFDAVVCYGGPLSFLLDRAEEGLGELLRVARPSGPILVGVASRFGTMRAFLPQVRDEIRDDGWHWTERVVATGDLMSPHSSLGVPMHLFTWDELRSLFARHGCEILSASASNFLATGDAESVQWFAGDPDRWQRFLDWEMRTGATSGAIDGGTQIVVAVRRS
jgi:SAM-dependent methyltransferase